MRSELADARAGFTLIEVLVSLSVLLAFATALGPMLFQSRHILSEGKGRVQADLLLRSLINAPFDRDAAQPRQTEGETNGFRWRVDVQPQFLETPPLNEKAITPKKDKQAWAAYRLTARVYWGHGQSVMAETVRLAKAGGEPP